MVGFGIRAGLLEVALTVRIWFSLAAPELMPLKDTVCTPASSLMLRSPIGFNVGGSLMALTVTVNVRLMVGLIVWPSLTVTVITTVPLALATGAKVNDPVGFGLL